MKVYTFYQRITIGGALGPLKMLKNHRDQMAVLKLWKQTWRRNGWEPEVLGIKDALQANETLSRAIMNAKNLYRSPSPKEYEMACYLRWVTMIARGGLMTDYDVMNRCFTPQEYALHIEKRPKDKAIFFANGCPCAVGGSSENHLILVEVLLDFERQPMPDSVHTRSSVSDQNIWATDQRGWQASQTVICPLYGESGWEKAPLVHYAHSKVRQHRAATIRETF